MTFHWKPKLSVITAQRESNKVFIADIDTNVFIFTVCFRFAAESAQRVVSMSALFCFPVLSAALTRDAGSAAR